MKSLLLATGLGLSLAACSTTGWSEAPLDERGYATRPPVSWWGRDAVSVNLFFEPLASYGSWGLHPHYGRVFYPSVGAGWQPYRAGYWRQDPRYGRMWMSGEPWGWATYHYGRWGRDGRMGWFWVPDTRFGPGWVDWRTSGDYVSWSPLPPYGWATWGTGWGNDWWSHAPAYWAWRPGMQQHVRPGRPGYPGRPDRPDRPDRPGDGQTVTPVPPNVHPRASPPYTGGRRNPRSDQTYMGGERQPRAGWQGGQRDGRPVETGRHPRSAPQRPEAADPARAQARPAPTPQVRSAPTPQVRPAPAPQVREAPQMREPQRAPSREPARGRDVPSRTADD